MSTPSSRAVAAAPAAVLWDMDGTLVDTEPYWVESEHALVAECGDTWSEEDARSIIGFDLLEAAAVLRDRGGVRLEPREIVERLEAGVIERVHQRVPWRPGARRLLSELNEAGVPCALVTMSWSRLAQAVVDELAPLRFDTVVTGDMVTRGKPHPEPYLRAAEILGVDATECIAIEDSPTGIKSATAAGCAVVAVPNIVGIEDGPGRTVIGSLKDVSADDLGEILATTKRGSPRPASPSRGGGSGAKRPAGSSGSRSGNGGGTSRAAARRRAITVGGGLLAAVAAVAIGASVFGGGDSPPPRKPGALNVHAWTPYWAVEDAQPELATRADTLHVLSPFWFQATGVDSIDVMPNAPEDTTKQFIDDARSRGVPLVASVLDATKAGVMAGILADPEQRAQHVDALASFADDGDFDGLDIDYEQFAFADGRDTWATTRPNWVAFIEELSTRLHDDGRTLTVSIPPVYDTGQSGDSGYWVYDYAGITPHVDHIRVMAYDYSVASGGAGPIAPLPWVDKVIAGTSAASGDPSKLVLGIPLYGYNWVVGTAGTCPETAEGNISQSLRNINDLVVRRGVTPQFVPGDYEMTFSYDLPVSDATTSCTQSRQVHFVDANGAQERMQHAVNAGFGGVALFSFGYEDQATWTAIDTIAAQLQPVPTGTGAAGEPAPTTTAAG